MTNAGFIGAAGGGSLAGRGSLIAAGLIMQLTIGALFSWSAFLTPLSDLTGWSESTLLTPYRFALACFAVGLLLAAYLSRRKSPRWLARVGGLLMIGGTVLAALSGGNLGGITLGIGVLGGFGAGFAYVAPVSTFRNWLPENRGVFLGLSVLCFGFGSLLAAPLLERMLGESAVAYGQTVPATFLTLAVFYAVGVVLPGGWFPATRAWLSPVSLKTLRGEVVAQESEGYRRWVSATIPLLRLWLLWAVYFLGAFAGVVALESRFPLLRESHWHEAWLAGGLCVVALAMLNRLGRTVWAAVAARVGRVVGLLLLVLVSALMSLAVSGGQPQLTPALAMIALAGFGCGGFLGLMPQLAAEMLDGPESPALRFGVMFSAFGLCAFAAPFWLSGRHPETLMGNVAMLSLSAALLLGFLYLLMRPTRTGSAVSQALAHWG